MIDILAVLIPALASLLHFTKKVSAKRLAIIAALTSAAALALCLISLRMSTTEYRYVLWPSEAANAGLKGGGQISSVDGVPIASLGDFLAAALNRNELQIHAQNEFRRHYNPDTWSFWRALDSYDLEEASGGLALSPRRPILHGGSAFVRSQVPGYLAEGFRIVAAQGIETPTIDVLLRVLEPVPQDGLISIRVMESTPDNGLRTIVYSPNDSNPDDKHVQGSPDELGQLKLGLSGLPLVVRSSGIEGGIDILHSLGSRDVFGPAALSKAIVEMPLIWQKKYPVDSDLCFFPRLTLLPHLFEHAWQTWIVGVPGTYLRQVLSLPNLFEILFNWDIIPKQYYLLDDGLTSYSFLFRLSSLAASLALALLLWSVCLQFERAAGFVEKRRFSFVLIVALLFQLADLMSFRSF